MQSEESGNKSIGIRLDVIVVIFEYRSKELVFLVANSFEHIFSICSVVEKGTALSLTCQGCHGINLSEHQ